MKSAQSGSIQAWKPWGGVKRDKDYSFSIFNCRKYITIWNFTKNKSRVYELSSQNTNINKAWRMT